MTIYEEFLMRVDDGESFYVDFATKSMKVGKQFLIKNGEYDKEKVLCHELTHAAMFSYNVDLTYEQEEVLADIIATYGQEIIHMANLLFKRLKDEREEERKNGSI